LGRGRKSLLTHLYNGQTGKVFAVRKDEKRGEGVKRIS
jgi:hypothetical protein